jgi:hypothetical protein
MAQDETGKMAADATAEHVARLEFRIAALRIGLSEMISILIQKKVLTKREAVSHFQGLADRVMPETAGDVGAIVFDEIANYVLAMPIPDDWKGSIMMSKEDAEAAVKGELRARNLTKPMSAAEVLMFCQEMYDKIQFRSKSDRLSDIRAWTDRWQSTMFR